MFGRVVDMKRLLSILMMAFATNALAYTATVNGITWTYTVSNGKASIGSGSSSLRAIPLSTSGAIAIPSMLGGYPVTSIGNYAFYRRSSLTSVTIPNSVTSIGDYAFGYCKGLASIEIPNGVKSIGKTAFYHCDALGNVTVPNSVTSIGNYAFQYCPNLTSITIPKSVTNVSYGVVKDCNALRNIVVPFVGKAESVTALKWLFATDPSNILPSVGSQSSSGSGGYGQSEVYYNTSVPASLKTVTITNAKTIADNAFRCCSNLTSIVLYDGVVSIGNSAFYSCSGIESITLPPSVTTLGAESFYHCRKLKKARLPNTLKGKFTEGNVFSDCAPGFSIEYYAPGAYVAFKGNGATSGSMANMTLKLGETKTLTANAFARTGYTFKGWNTKSDGTGVAYANKATINNLSGTAIVLYAQWTANKYTVKFNGNGASSGSMKAVSRTYGDGKALPANAFKRTGYSFIGWSTTKGGSVKYTDKQKGDISSKNGAEVTLYAVWADNAYIVKFNGNGATSGSMGAQMITIGKSKALTANAFARTGYTFQGWAKKSTGSVAYKNKATVKDLSTKNGATVTLYAVWKANTYKIAFNANGGSGTAPKTVTATYDKAVTLPANTFKRSGYTFLGWNTDKNAATAKYKDKASVKNLAASGTVTLYAIWKKNGSSGSGGGSSGTQTQKKTVVRTFESEEEVKQYIISITKTTEQEIVITDRIQIKDELIPIIKLKLFALVKITGGVICYVDSVKKSGPIFGNPNANMSGVTIEVPNGCVAFDTLNGLVFENCTFKGPVCKYAHNCKFINCSVILPSAVTGTNIHGMFAEYAENCQFVGCSANGTLDSNTQISVGGIVGTAENCTFSGCSVKGTVIGREDVGGIAGRLFPNGTNIVENCTVNANVSGKGTMNYSVVGGIAGLAGAGSMISFCTVTGAVSGEANWCGGIVGDATNADIRQCESSASVKGVKYVGGIAGDFKNSVLYGVRSTGSVTGQLYVGGAIGVAQSSKMEYSEAAGAVVAKKLSAEYSYVMYIGGFVGEAKLCNIAWCGAKGKVSGADGSDFIGGFAGYLSGTLECSFATGAVSGGDKVGGLIGGINKTSSSKYADTLVRNCYARGSAKATGLNGGWAAALIASTGDGTGMSIGGSPADNVTVVNCYATGKTSAPNAIWPWTGGLSPDYTQMPGMMEKIKATSSYWDKKTTGQDYSILMGKGKTTAEMGKQSTYSGWDFNKIWKMSGGYPVLRLNQNYAGTASSGFSLANASDSVYIKWTPGNCDASRVYIREFGKVEWVLIAETTLDYVRVRTVKIDSRIQIKEKTKYEIQVRVITKKKVKKVIKTVTITTGGSSAAGKYTLKFNANGGTGSMKSVSRTCGVAEEIPANTFKRKNYTFSGWATTKGGSVKYEDREAVSLSSKKGATVTLYAVWSRNKYTIAFNANGGTGKMKNISASSGAAKKLPANAFKKAGYSFKGWNTKANGKGTSYKDKASIKLTKADGATVTLYAQWKPNTYKIVFDKNGGKGTAPKTITAKFDKTVTLPANTFKRSGYTFQGWSRNKSGNIVFYKDKAKVKNLTGLNGAKIILYAVWKQNPYTVKFNANGGSGTMKPQAIDVGAYVSLSRNAFTRLGYGFKGWAKSKGGKVVYYNGAFVENLAKGGKSITLYAVWEVPSTIVGTYDGYVGEGHDEDGLHTGVLKATIAASGKMSASVAMLGKTYSFSAAGFSKFVNGVYTYSMSTADKKSSLTLVADSSTSEWTVVMEDEMCRFTAPGYSNPFYAIAWKNEFGASGKVARDSRAASHIANLEALKTVYLKLGEGVGNVYPLVLATKETADLTMTIGKAGKVTLTGKALGVTVNATSQLVIDDADIYTCNTFVIPVVKTGQVIDICADLIPYSEVGAIKLADRVWMIDADCCIFKP